MGLRDCPPEKISGHLLNYSIRKTAKLWTSSKIDSKPLLAGTTLYKAIQYNTIKAMSLIKVIIKLELLSQMFKPTSNV